VEEGWEYGLSFISKFHVKPRTRDFARRKRLLKEIKHEKDANLSKVELPPRLTINLKIRKHKSVSISSNGVPHITSCYVNINIISAWKR
jgi:hypothetical protein